MRIIKVFDRFFTSVTVLSVFLMFSTVTLQVVARFGFTKSPSWTEEAARFFFIAAITFAAPIAMKNREYVRVDLILSWLPHRMLRFLEVIVDVFIIVFIWTVARFAVDFMKLGAVQTAPTMDIPMSIPFSGILITCVFIGIYGVLNLVEDVRVLGKGVK